MGRLDKPTQAQHDYAIKMAKAYDFSKGPLFDAMMEVLEEMDGVWKQIAKDSGDASEPTGVEVAKILKEKIRSYL